MALGEGEGFELEDFLGGAGVGRGEGDFVVYDEGAGLLGLEGEGELEGAAEGDGGGVEGEVGEGDGGVGGIAEEGECGGVPALDAGAEAVVDDVV